MKKRDIKINFSNRWIYTFIILGIITIVSVGVYAAAPNPGHTSSEIDFANGINVATTGNPPIELRSTNGGTPYIDFSNDGSSDYDMRLILMGNDALTIDGGNVGIGTTAPVSKLSVGANGESGAAIYGYSTNGRGVRGDGAVAGVYGRNFNSGSVGMLGYSGNGVWGSGTIGVYAIGNSYDFFAIGPGVDYGAYSSIRVKENIVEIDNALDKVLALRGVYFDWNKEHGGEHDMGMIAEEVGEVVPEIVIYEDRTNRSNYYVENGERKLYATGIDYGALTPMLVEAIKELKSENDDLKSELCSKDNSYSWC